MAGLDPAIHVFLANSKAQSFTIKLSKAWMPATSAGMTAVGVTGAGTSERFRAFCSAKNTYPRSLQRIYVVRALLIEGVVLSGVG